MDRLVTNWTSTLTASLSSRYSSDHFTSSNSYTTINITQFSNSTLTTVVWGRTSISLATIAVLGALLNGTALIVFLRERALQTSFTLHVMHLLLLNVLCCLCQYSLAAVVNLNASSGRHWYLGGWLCDFYLLAQCMLNAGISNIHGLMAVNRAWAIIHPLSYRERNSKRLAVQLGAGLWAYLGMVEFPYWLMDKLYYRQPEALRGCIFNRYSDPKRS